MYAFRKRGMSMSGIAVVDEIGYVGVVVRAVELDSLLRWGVVVDLYVENYGALADFCGRYQVTMMTLRGDFVRLMVMQRE